MATKINKQNLFKAFLQFIFIAAFSLTFLPDFFQKTISFHRPNDIKEQYNPQLKYIDNLEAFESYIKKELKNNLSDTGKLVNTIDNVLRERFYHGYSEYTLSDNWLAYLCSKFLYEGCIYPVIENDILKYPMAACSQQGLVFQAMLKKFGIIYGTTAFTGNDRSPGGHYAVSAFYSNSWHFFDSNQEPIKLKGNPPLEVLLKDSNFQKIYPNLDSQWLEEKVKLGLVKRMDINKFNAPKMHILQTLTGFLSRWLWFISLAILIFYHFQSKAPFDTSINTNTSNRTLTSIEH